MPELPDVESFRRYLDATSLHRRIAHVHVADARILHGISARGLHRRLTGRRMEATRRHGKHLLARLDDATWLTLHFGMTGRLKAFEDMADDPRYDRVRFDFEDGNHLAYENRRMLGRVGMADNVEAFIKAEGLGPDALDPAFDEAAFAAAVGKRRGLAKAALMDQTLLAGVGNIYADEILFQAGLHPKAKLQDLDAARLARLYRTMRAVLQTAIDRGAGSEELVERLPPSYLLPHREKGAKCPRCGGAIQVLKISGRSACFCPRCQPE
ncbi:MAG: DNA-formamidopyrimidine glycosylase [Kiloniellaceae bacterium]